jgi:hypothetical protein
VALVEEDAVDDALDRLIQWRIVENDVGGLATELQAQALGRIRDAALDQLSDLVEPVNAILSTSSCSTSALPIAGPPAMTLTTPGGGSHARR